MKTYLKLLALESVPAEQKGRKYMLIPAIAALPRKPYAMPAGVMPPLVPLGTRRVGFVMRMGWDFERMPSSLERVSAVTET